MEFIWYWFAYSFLGYCLEKLFAAATRSKHRLRRCFVFLPLCPVYGFAMLAILLLGAEDLPGAWEQLLLGTLVSTSVEYAVHWTYEKLFAVRFWDYSATKCDVNGRICLPFSLCWGALTLLAVRYVQPVLANFAARPASDARHRRADAAHTRNDKQANRLTVRLLDVISASRSSSRCRCIPPHGSLRSGFRAAAPGRV